MNQNHEMYLKSAVESQKQFAAQSQFNCASGDAIGGGQQRKLPQIEGVVGFDANHNIGDVVRHLNMGGKAARAGWNGKGQFIALQVPDAHSKMGLPYVYIRTAQGRLVPWVVSQTDLLANDWALLPASFTGHFTCQVAI